MQFQRLLPVSSCSDLEQMVQTTFKLSKGQSSSDLVASQEFQNEKNSLGDSVILIVLLPELHLLPLDQMVDILRLMDLVQRISSGDTTLNNPGELQISFNQGNGAAAVNLSLADRHTLSKNR